MYIFHPRPFGKYTARYDNKVRELIAVKSVIYTFAEYHRGSLQSTPLGKLFTNASA
jgi:hypothetical protein